MSREFKSFILYFQCYVTGIYEASSGIFTSDQGNLFKLLWFLVDILNKAADKKIIHKIGIICNIGNWKN